MQLVPLKIDPDGQVYSTDALTVAVATHDVPDITYPVGHTVFILA